MTTFRDPIVPPEYDENTISLTFDVEWAPDAVIHDVLKLLEERKLLGTFFATHNNINVLNHELGIHPNFRRNGETYRSIKDAAFLSDTELAEEVLRKSLDFAPNSVGVRAHSLYFDSALLPLYGKLGLEYDASQRSELVGGLRPFWKQHNILEIPAYYADYFDLVTGATQFSLSKLKLSTPGLKVFDFHPVLIFTNPATVADYEAIKPIYNNEEMLFATRRPGRGVRTLFIALLDAIANGDYSVLPLVRINNMWRSTERLHLPKW